MFLHGCSTPQRTLPWFAPHVRGLVPWSDPALRNDVVDHLRYTYDYYGFCDACLNQHANGTLSLLEPTMRARQRAKNRTV